MPAPATGAGAAASALAEPSPIPSADAANGPTAVEVPARPIVRGQGGPPAPRVPVPVTATALGEDRVEIRWQPSPDPRGDVEYEVLRGPVPVARTLESRAEEGGLSAATEYCYTVVARDAGGQRSRQSPPACATTLDRTPPTSPSGVVAEARSDHVVALRWDASRDNVRVARYEVLRGGDVIAVVETTSSEEIGLSPAREYCYSVRALDAAGNTSLESRFACAKPPDLTPPSAPPGARASALDDRRIAVRWNASTDEVGVVRYEIETPSGPVVKVTALEWIEGDLRPWTERCYRVRAVDAAGNRSPPAGPLCARTLDLVAPSSPADPSAVASSEVRVELTWSAAQDDSLPGVVEYEILRNGRKVASTAQTRASEQGLRPFREYCYTVVALDSAGNRSAPAGPVCARTPDVTPPTAPGGLVLYRASDSQLEAGWRPSTDNNRVAGYELVRGERVERVPGAPAMESGLAPDTEYCYRVRAFDAAGNRSAETGPVCARTLAPGQPPQPRNVVVRSASKVVLEWDRVRLGPEIVYRVYEDGQRVGATRFPAYTISRSGDARRRCYTVTTLSGAGSESPPSDEACAGPLSASKAASSQ